MIAAFDTETTGLTLHPDAPLEKQPRIIELGVVLVDPKNYAAVDTFSQLVNPGEPLTAEITKITGIADADLVGMPTFVECLPALAAFFARADTVVAFNLPFDRQMMRNELERAGTPAFPWPQRELCLMAYVTHLWGRNPKLKELYQWAMGEPLEQKHRAVDDVMAMVRVMEMINFGEE